MRACSTRRRRLLRGKVRTRRRARKRSQASTCRWLPASSRTFAWTRSLPFSSAICCRFSSRRASARRASSIPPRTCCAARAALPRLSAAWNTAPRPSHRFLPARTLRPCLRSCSVRRRRRVAVAEKRRGARRGTRTEAGRGAWRACAWPTSRRSWRCGQSWGTPC